jgi:ABC-2 type transport system permease protein
MLSLPLLRTTIKANYIIWLIFAAILAMYFSFIVSMYDPITIDTMNALVEALPPQLVDALNFKTADASLLGFIAGYFYGFLILLFPLIYSVIMADRMIARHVDSGAMGFLLSTPNTRTKIALTQAVFLNWQPDIVNRLRHLGRDWLKCGHVSGSARHPKFHQF